MTPARTEMKIQSRSPKKSKRKSPAPHMATTCFALLGRDSVAHFLLEK